MMLIEQIIKQYKDDECLFGKPDTRVFYEILNKKIVGNLEWDSFKIQFYTDRCIVVFGLLVQIIQHFSMFWIF